MSITQLLDAQVQCLFLYNGLELAVSLRLVFWMVDQCPLLLHNLLLPGFYTAAKLYCLVTDAWVYKQPAGDVILYVTFLISENMSRYAVNCCVRMFTHQDLRQRSRRDRSSNWTKLLPSPGSRSWRRPWQWMKTQVQRCQFFCTISLLLASAMGSQNRTFSVLSFRSRSSLESKFWPGVGVSHLKKTSSPAPICLIWTFV